MKRAAWLWMIALAGAAVGLYLALPVWDRYREQDQERTQKVAREAEAKARYDRAAREADAVRSEAGGEEWLRKQGHRAPNEVPLR